MVPAGQGFASRFTSFTAPLLVFCDDLYVDADQRSNVGDQCSIAGCDQDVAMLGDDAGHHLLDAWIGASRMGVDFAQDSGLRLDGNVGGGGPDRVEVARRLSAPAHSHSAGRGGALGDRSGGRSGQHRAVGADLVGVRVPLAFSGLRAHAHALLQVAVTALDDALFEDHRVASRVFEEEVCVIDSP
jgi:hypothetical protein